MPKLEDLVVAREKKKFKKKNYRAWDLSGTKINTTDRDSNTNPLNKSESELDNNKVTIRQQLDNTLDNNKITIRQQLDNTLDNNQPIIKQGSDSYQITNEKKISENSVSTSTLDLVEITEKIVCLSGIQKAIFVELFLCCLANKKMSTGPVDSYTLTEKIGCSYGSFKVSLQRLVLKGLVIRNKGKRAKGGYIAFKIPISTYDVAYSIYLRNSGSVNFFNREEIDFAQKISAEESDKNQITIRKQLDNNLSLSSSRDNRSTTTLPYDWKKIDLSLLTKIPLPKNTPRFFHSGQIKSIYKAAGHQLSAEDIQRSIYHFAYGYIHYQSDERYASLRKPLAALYTLLKEGGNWDEPRYLTPEEEKIKIICNNIIRGLDEKKPDYFNEWLKKDYDKKYAYYRKLLPSNHYYSDREYRELALKDFEKVHWSTLCIEETIKLMGEEYRSFVEKLYAIKQIELSS